APWLQWARSQQRHDTPLGTAVRFKSCAGRSCAYATCLAASGVVPRPIEYVVPRTSDPCCGASATLAKQKYVVPSGIMLYCRVITDGVRKAWWTAHSGHDP